MVLVFSKFLAKPSSLPSFCSPLIPVTTCDPSFILSFGFCVSERYFIEASGKGQSLVHLSFPLRCQALLCSFRAQSNRTRFTFASISTNPFNHHTAFLPSLNPSLAVMRGLGITSAGIAAATWFAASAVAQLDPIVIKVCSFDWLHDL